MQPQYDIRWSDQFTADVTAICGELRVFDEAFSGFDWYLSRLPRGPGTWDLSPLGDLRLTTLEGGRLEDGTDYPTIYFTFRLHLGPTPFLELLRAFREDDPALSGLMPASPQPPT